MSNGRRFGHSSIAVSHLAWTTRSKGGVQKAPIRATRYADFSGCSYLVKNAVVSLEDDLGLSASEKKGAALTGSRP